MASVSSSLRLTFAASAEPPWNLRYKDQTLSGSRVTRQQQSCRMHNARSRTFE
jgi:hypothetical protein